jgi:hypothetical protein
MLKVGVAVRELAAATEGRAVTARELGRLDEA